MDYYQGVVVEYLRADRAVFVNTECCIQLNPGKNPDVTGPHWYCDAVALDLRRRIVLLCEVSYSSSLAALLSRLGDWSENWSGVRAALIRDCLVESTWTVQPWLFVPNARREGLQRKLALLCEPRSAMPMPLITDLENVVPWKYAAWNRHDNPPATDA